jgi:hypothetical protein
MICRRAISFSEAGERGSCDGKGRENLAPSSLRVLERGFFTP